MLLAEYSRISILEMKASMRRNLGGAETLSRRTIFLKNKEVGIPTSCRDIRIRPDTPLFPDVKSGCRVYLGIERGRIH